MNDMNIDYLSEDYSDYSSDCSEDCEECRERNMLDKISFLFPQFFLEEPTNLESILSILKNINNSRSITKIDIYNRKDLNDFFDYLMDRISHDENILQLSLYWDIFIHYEKLIDSKYDKEWKIDISEENYIIYSNIDNYSLKSFSEFSQRCNIFFNKYFSSYKIDIIRSYKNNKNYILIYLNNHKIELK